MKCHSTTQSPVYFFSHERIFKQGAFGQKQVFFKPAHSEVGLWCWFWIFNCATCTVCGPNLRFWFAIAPRWHYHGSCQPQKWFWMRAHVSPKWYIKCDQCLLNIIAWFTPFAAQVWEGTWPPSTSCEAGPFVELSDRLPGAPHENVCRWWYSYYDEMAISIARCLWPLIWQPEKMFGFRTSSIWRDVLKLFPRLDGLLWGVNKYTDKYGILTIKHWGKKFGWWWTSSCTGGGFFTATDLLWGNEPRSSQPSCLHGFASLEKLSRLHFLLQLSVVYTSIFLLTNINETLESKTNMFS